VGGRRFTTLESTLLSHGDNFFSGLLSGNYESLLDEDGAYFIDRNGSLFGLLLDFLRTGKLSTGDLYGCDADDGGDAGMLCHHRGGARRPLFLATEKYTERGQLLAALCEEAHFYSIAPLMERLDDVVRPVPRIQFEDVGGYTMIKAELKSIIDEVRESLQAGSIYEMMAVRPAKCLLFYGPAGCGKSHLAAAFANYCGAELAKLDQGEAMFARRLHALAEATEWTVVFFREFDAILADADYSKVVTEFVDAVQENPHVFVIARSSRPAGLWESPLMASGRIDQRIYVPLPDEQARLEVIELLLEPVPLDSDDICTRMAAATHGYSPADLKRMCQVMCRIALREYLDGLGAEATASSPRQGPVPEIRVAERHLRRSCQAVRATYS
jgi:SpoVK/Ycf46/Vps4 family AAA+-type ATPase